MLACCNMSQGRTRRKGVNLLLSSQTMSQVPLWMSSGSSIFSCRRTWLHITLCGVEHTNYSYGLETCPCRTGIICILCSCLNSPNLNSLTDQLRLAHYHSPSDFYLRGRFFIFMYITCWLTVVHSDNSYNHGTR
jgi:hypothetical protein